MEKKQILISCVFAGIGLAFVPGVFMKGIIVIILKWIGYLVMTGGVIFFIAGDVLLKGSFKKKSLSQLQDEEIIEQYKHKTEIQKLKRQVEKEKIKSEINKYKQQSTTNKQGSKLPDVLGNIGGLMQNSNQQQDYDYDRHTRRKPSKSVKRGNFKPKKKTNKKYYPPENNNFDINNLF